MNGFSGGGIRVVLVIATLCGVPSCATQEIYPSALPPLADHRATPDGCPPLAGTYVDAGTAYGGDGVASESVSLMQLLAGAAAGDRRDAVTITLEGGSLGVAVAGLPSTRRSLAPDAIMRGSGDGASSFACDRGVLWFVVRSDGDELRLQQATDRSLVILRLRAGWNISAGVTYTHRSRTWYRFAPVSR